MCGNVSNELSQSCEKLTEAGSRMPIATTFRCGKAKSNSASFWSSRSEHVQRKLNCTHGLEDLSSCMRTKCSGRTAMSWASRGTVRRNGRHGQHSFCWRTSSIASVPCVITKKEGVVSLYRKTRKKVFVQCLLHRAPRLVGCSCKKETVFSIIIDRCAQRPHLAYINKKRTRTENSRSFFFRNRRYFNKQENAITATSQHHPCSCALRSRTTSPTSFWNSFLALLVVPPIASSPSSDPCAQTWECET